MGSSHTSNRILLYTCVPVVHILLQSHLVVGKGLSSTQTHGSGAGLRLAHQQRSGAFIGWSEQHKESSSITITGVSTAASSSNGSSGSSTGASSSKLLVVHTKFGKVGAGAISH